jgi:hypothetical protein
MSTQINFTFLGADKSFDSGYMYTPLIIPNITNTDMNSANIGGSTPFSKIKNYIMDSIRKGDISKIPIQTINVLEDFLWTISPKSSKQGNSIPSEAVGNNYRNIADEVPYIILKEKYFLVNNIIAQGLYSLTSATDIVPKDLSKYIKDIIANIGDKIDSGAAGETVKSTANSVGNISKSVISSVDENIASHSALYAFNNPDLEAVLFPYQKLYIVGPTGFKYKLPYLTSNVLNNVNSFGGTSDSSVGQLQNLISAGTGIAEIIGGTANILSQAGSAKIERSKYYQYPDSGPAIELTIPLYNTRPATYADVCNNFKLVFLLLYQNLPLRQDKIIVEPPVIYDVTIPGNRRDPYCYISSLQINYKGNTRMMEISTNGIGHSTDANQIPPTIKTIIPDMYELKIQLQPMLATTKNMLYTTIQNNVVQTGKV